MLPQFPERFNMADYFLYHNLEEGRENKICLYYEDQAFSYGDTARMSNRVGNALRELGVEMEDRVLLVLPDCPEFVWSWFGAARIGAVITMVNPLLPVEDYKYYLDYTRARAAVVHESLLKTFNEATADAKYLRVVLVVGGYEHDEDVDFTNDALLWSSLMAPCLANRTNARLPTPIATTSRSGYLLPARLVVQRARSICNTICLSIPKSLPNKPLASMKTI